MCFESLFGKKNWYGGVIPKVIGEFNDIGTVSFRFPQGSWSKIFYPCEPTSLRKQERYMRKDAVKGMAQWLGVPSIFFHPIGTTPHPFKNDAKVKSGQQFPIVFFSHGLGGNGEMYQKMCGDIASLGYIVIAFEHEDGSGCFAKPISYTGNEKDAKPIFYRKPPEGMPYEKEAVVQFRASFLKQRKVEILKALLYIEERDFDDIKNEMTKNVFNAMEHETIFLSGHSFGGCSTVYCSFDEDIQNRIQGCVLLDLWSFPLPIDMVKRGMPIQTLSILSGEFISNGEDLYTRELFSNTEKIPVHSYYIPSTCHQQFSDAPFVLGGYLSRKAKSVGETPKEVSQHTTIESIRAFLKNSIPETHENLVKL